jgi:hypothetical protein
MISFRAETYEAERVREQKITGGHAELEREGPWTEAHDHSERMRKDRS